MNAPRNAAHIIAMRLAGKAPAYGVVISYVGATRYVGMPHVYCDSGKDYDMRFLAGLQVVVVVKPGVKCMPVLRKLWSQYLNVNTPTDGMPMVVDIEREHLAWVSSDNPRAWMQAKPEHPAYQAMFQWRG